LFRLFSKTVAVTFVDVATGKQIAASNMPVEQLPDTFALDTTLDLAGQPYSVVSAEPLTKAEFAKTKRLSVGLRRLETLDPNKILFSLPSICGAALPSLLPSTRQDGIVVLHEDDWRQCEFISRAHADDVSAELAGIQHVHENERASVGWRKIHVRERIPHPMPPGTTWDAVRQILGDPSPVGGVAFGQHENSVAGAVGARLPEQVILWGATEGGSLTALCVESIDEASAPTQAALARVADELSCVIVRWCKCQTYGRNVMIENTTGALWTP
jgi:hypothetical protein